VSRDIPTWDGRRSPLGRIHRGIPGRRGKRTSCTFAAPVGAREIAPAPRSNSPSCSSRQEQRRAIVARFRDKRRHVHERLRATYHVRLMRTMIAAVAMWIGLAAVTTASVRLSHAAGRDEAPSGLIGLGRHSPERGNELIAVSPTGRVRGIAAGEITGFGWSPDGRQVVLSRIEGDESPAPAFLGIADDFHDPNDEAGLKPVAAHTADFRDLQPAWSPDGDWIAFSRHDLKQNTARIEIVRTDGTDHRQLSAVTAAIDFNPRWSPNGRKIAFVREQGEAQDLVVVDRRGNEVALTSNGLARGDFWWAPEGDRLVFASGDTSEGDLFTVRSDGSALDRLTSDGAPKFTPRWSPDGESVVYAQGSGLALDLYVLRLGGGGPQRLTEQAGREINPTWAPNSRFLAYLHFPPGFPDAGYTTEEPGELKLLAIDSGDARTLADGRFNVFGIAWQPKIEGSDGGLQSS
jgi:Tol biopolymer transport system component